MESLEKSFALNNGDFTMINTEIPQIMAFRVHELILGIKNLLNLDLSTSSSFFVTFAAFKDGIVSVEDLHKNFLSLEPLRYFEPIKIYKKEVLVKGDKFLLQTSDSGYLCLSRKENLELPLANNFDDVDNMVLPKEVRIIDEFHLELGNKSFGGFRYFLEEENYPKGRSRCYRNKSFKSSIKFV